MRPKLYRGSNDRNYVRRRLREIHEAQNPYRGLRAGLQEILDVLAMPNPITRRLVRMGRA